MKLAEALPILQAACGRPFGELFVGHPEDLWTNKGNVGQLILRYIGLELNSDLTDFEDGELKTNKSLTNGLPLETMFITQISKSIDALVGPAPVPFVGSSLYSKIRNLLFLPVVKAGEDASDWYFVRCVHVEAQEEGPLFRKLREDYETICSGLRAHIETSTDGFIHTTNGPHYLQVRSKDVVPYHPIYSKTYDRLVSNKNHAFYFKKAFMIEAQMGYLEVPTMKLGDM